MEHRKLSATGRGACLLLVFLGAILLLASYWPLMGAAAVSQPATPTVPCRKGAGSSQGTLLPCGTETPTTTPTSPAPSPSWTPTSMPGPPTLIDPADGITMTQPVPPYYWYFSWWARQGPCYCMISIRGPGGRSIGARVDYYGPSGYSYTYTSTHPLPNDALTPWFWDVSVHCPLGSNYSETRTFSVWPAGTFCDVYFPIVQVTCPSGLVERQSP